MSRLKTGSLASKLVVKSKVKVEKAFNSRLWHGWKH